jgi:hypothetical protein
MHHTIAGAAFDRLPSRAVAGQAAVIHRANHLPKRFMNRKLVIAIVLASVGVRPAQSSAQIFLPGTQPGDLVNWPLIEPSDCTACHGRYVAGRDYEPFDSWGGSMMANSARDPLFWAAVDIANQDEPGAGEFCIRCHSPRAWLAGRSSVPDGSALTGYPNEPDNDFEGIDCHFCHRMYEGPEGTPFTQNGQYWVDDGTPVDEPARRGPYLQTFAPHPTAQSTYHGSSEFCGACHDLRNPLRNLLDAEGQDTGRLFPEQTTYTEWARSAFAAEGTSCQDCHMPVAEVDPAFACSSFNPPRPTNDPGDDAPVFRHDLSGANSFMLEVIKGEYGADLNRTGELQAGIDRALQMLQGAATVELDTDPVAVEGDTLNVGVRVTNLTGHKLPTGYPEGRRMWLEVLATDALGTPFFVSGEYDGATATLVTDAQLRVYETLHGAHGQGPGFHLVLNERIYSDTRIPPRGFVPDPDTTPVGRDYPVLPDSTIAHWDDAGFRVPIPPGIQGRTRLRYQTASRDYVEFLRDENASGPDPHDRNYPNAADRGQKMYDLWTAYGMSAPVDMVSADVVVPVKAPPAPVAGLSSVPGHEVVHLGWDPLPVGVAEVRILRIGWGDYPELGSTGSVAPKPAPVSDYDDALAAGWGLVYSGSGTSVTDTLLTGRDVFLYGAWHFDSSGVGSPGRFIEGRNYRIGDFGEVGVPAAWDGLIDGPNDLPVFSAAWGTRDGEPGFDPVVDIAPTHDGTRHGISRPDDMIDFDDLVLFSLQYGTSEEGPLGALRTNPGATVISLEPRGGELLVSAERNGAALHALVLELPRDSGIVLADAHGGAALPASHFAAALQDGEGTAVGFAVLGPGQTPANQGPLLWLRLAGPETDRIPSALLDAAHWSGTDAAGDPVPIEIRNEAPAAPGRRRLVLSSPMPNPFNPRTRVELWLPEAGVADIAVFDLAGRRVRTLLHSDLAAGAHPVSWDGLDEKGNAVASGTYLIRAEALGASDTRRAVLVR